MSDGGVNSDTTWNADGSTATPFLKWAGSKRRLLSKVDGVLPKRFGTYWEPFLGSGAVFLHTQPVRAHLSDRCGPLIRTWQIVRDHPAELIRALESLRPTKTQFYAVRANPSDDPIIRAAEFIYLNKTCWNGLYRVNSSGRFNVPYGTPKNGRVFDSGNLLSCSALLSRGGVRLIEGDFERALLGVKAGDLVFLDPPYIARHADNGFIEYNETLFSWADQERLSRVAVRLASRGAHVVITNSGSEDVLRLYDGFDKTFVHRKCTIAARPEHRTKFREVILYHAGSIVQ